jgi:hypothetical protein
LRFGGDWRLSGSDANWCAPTAEGDVAKMAQELVEKADVDKSLEMLIRNDCKILGVSLIGLDREELKETVDTPFAAQYG